MTNLRLKSELLTAICRIVGIDGEVSLADGALDKALWGVFGLLPLALRSGLSFRLSDRGYHCHDLPDLLSAAGKAKLITMRSATSFTVNVDMGWALQLLLVNGLTLEDARFIGETVRSSMTAIAA